MSLKHRVYGFIFNIFRIFPIKENSISFVSDKNESFNDDFRYIYREFKKLKHNPDFSYNYIIKNKISINNIYKLARSNYIFLNDNFFPLAYMNISDKTKVIQLWHGAGGFKKFGYSTTLKEDKDLINLIRKSSNKTDYLFITSKNYKKDFMEAFQIDADKIYPLGMARLDYFAPENLKNENVLKIKSKFEKTYPDIKNKKIILYAPTFRETAEYNNIFRYFDIKKFNDNLSDEYVLFLRLHPKMYQFGQDNNLIDEALKLDNVYDLTDYESIEELMLISDILITDYSSLMVEYTILDKPIILFAYDLDNYLKYERGFYIDYKKDVPGTIVKTTDELINTIKNENFNTDRLEEFKNLQFDNLDGKASRRIVEFVLNHNKM
ncbi:CDP-glycerol glycerophosphotransferase family protein [Methanobrevibacter sp.]